MGAPPPLRTLRTLTPTQLQHNRLPTFTELDADSFQEVMNAPHKPLVVLVAAPRAALHDAADRVRAIAQHIVNVSVLNVDQAQIINPTNSS